MSPTTSEVPRRDFYVPQGWVETKLGEIYQLEYGKNLTQKARNTSGKYPVYGSNGMVDHHDNFLVEGPVLVIGRKGAVGAVSLCTKACWPIDTTYYLRESQHVDIRFSLYLFKYFRLNQLDRSTAIPGLNRDDAYDLVVHLPPLAEQRRIVAKIEELFSELDKGTESLQAACRQLAVYRQAVLKHAFEGKLTAQWRTERSDTKTANEFLRNILVERRRIWEEYQLRKFAEKGKTPPKNWRKKYKEPVTVDATELPLLPVSWCWSSIDQLLREPLRNGYSAVASQNDIGIPTFSISAVTEGDFSSKNIKMTSADPLKVQDLWVESDDIFVQRSNTPELVGTARRYRGENGAAIFPDLLIRIRVTSSVLPRFVELALQSVRCHAYFRHKSQGISGSMPKIDQKIVRLAAIPLLPLPEQEAIVEAVEGRLTVIDRIEAEIDNHLLKGEVLRQAILKKAFAGQLVAQNPNDEPASVLLDRIKAERKQKAKSGMVRRNTRKKRAAA